jgi:hypothetical protein
MSALGVLVIVIFGYKEQRVPVTAFILAFSAEVIEGVICYAGEVNTMGPLPITIAFRVTILCALVTGLYASSISGKGPKDAARLVKFDGGAALLGGLIVMGTFFL